MTLEDKVDNIEARVSKMEKMLLQIKAIVIGIAIGIVITGLVFGIITFKEIQEVVKTVK